MYSLKTVGSTKSPVKDDSEILELEDVSNKIVEHTTENTDHKKLNKTIFMIIENKDVTVSFVMLHSLAFLTSTISIAIIVIRREMTKVHDSNIWTFKSILYGHLYTLHSWIGATTLLMFLLQWLSSVFIFMIPCLQYKGLPLGKKFSLSTLFIATTALLTGVNEHAVYSLVNGLIKSGAMKLEDRPLWYDVYRAFPPDSEPHYAKSPLNYEIQNIFYQEDKFRASFHKKLGQSLLPPIDLKGPVDKNPTKLAIERSLDDVDDVINSLRNDGILPQPFINRSDGRRYQKIIENCNESDIAGEFKKYLAEKSSNTTRTDSSSSS
ncbi:uncharacterized protein LOC126907713 isoform X2 [Daktulosphaira vitifoliae]|uniref:uncharacterized protein LOC126907713 isoform X2 n=1 Tax=Daktulosphaira vitifoliae TaxID=58002 RepID=UPI0021AA9C05|nr:uncharacterized protein LOC126907713 isoform X2 [Daktulosphaira vitifoliae]